MDLWDEPSSAVDFGFDELVDLPMRWLEKLVDYLPDWPTTWIPDGPPEWLIDLIEKYAPVLEKYLPSSYIQDLIHMGLPHFYVQQNVCEKAFDIGVLVLTLGSLLVAYFLLRRCLAMAEAGYSRGQSGFVCDWCRAEKTEILPEELSNVEKKVENLRTSCQSVNKKLLACLQGQGTDGSAIDKRMKKLPEMLLSGCMSESSAMLGGDSIFGNILNMCGKVQKLLGNELLEYETEVEKKVIGKQSEILEADIPSISKQRKQLAKLTLDMDSARTRYQTASRHSIQAGNNAAKADVIKEEMEDASLRVEQCRDALVGDMFGLISKESEFAQHLVTLVKIQAQYHKKALAILETYTRHMEEEISNSSCRPAYGCKLEDHLKVTDRHIALPIEVCVCFIVEYCMSEEGLFRVAGSASKLKKLKAAFDANVWDILDMNDYIKDPHAVAGALKMYLRELPVPLMTHVLYNEWMHAARVSDADSRLKALWTVVQKLPVPYYNNLKYLMKFLNKLTHSQETTKMTAQNLAIVMAPNLIWSAEEGSSALGMNMSLANTYSLIVDSLIAHADYFFPGDVEFDLPSPIMKLPEAFGSSSGNLNYVDAEPTSPANGDVPSGLQVSDGNAMFMHPSASPQMGGSPKSLRRNKKPAPPAPSMLRERPSVTPEKSNFDKLATTEKTFERNVPIAESQPFKPVIERKLSSSSDKSLSPSGSLALRTNHTDRAFFAMEKPQIPEKPSFEKRSSVANDLKTSFPIPAERHHIERQQNSTFSAEKPPLAVSEDLPPLAQDESRPLVPEIISSAVVEYESSEDESPIITHRPPRIRSPLHTDITDHYRPDWYGIEEMTNGHHEEQEQHHQPAKLTLEEEMLKISREAERLMKEKLSSEPFRIESILKDDLSSEMSDTSSVGKDVVAAAQEDKEPEVVASISKSSESNVSSVRVQQEPVFIGPSTAQLSEGSLIEPQVLDNLASLKKAAQPQVLDNLASLKKATQPQVLDNLASLKKAAQPQEISVKTLIPPPLRLFTKSPERLLSSEQLIMIDLPPHSMQFVKPRSCEDISSTTKEHGPIRQQMSFDLLGNLTFVSCVSPSPKMESAEKPIEDKPSEVNLNITEQSVNPSETFVGLERHKETEHQKELNLMDKIEVTEQHSREPKVDSNFKEKMTEELEIEEKTHLEAGIRENLESEIGEDVEPEVDEFLESEVGDVLESEVGDMMEAEGSEILEPEVGENIEVENSESGENLQASVSEDLEIEVGEVEKLDYHRQESPTAMRNVELEGTSGTLEDSKTKTSDSITDELRTSYLDTERTYWHESPTKDDYLSSYTKDDYTSSPYSKDDYSLSSYTKDDYTSSPYTKDDYTSSLYTKDDYDYSTSSYTKDEYTGSSYAKDDYSSSLLAKDDYFTSLLAKDDYSTSLLGVEDVLESESPQTVKDMDTADDYLRRSSEDFSYLSSSNYPLQRVRTREYYGTESRSDSITDSDDWNYSEGSVEKPLRLTRSGRQESQESKSSDDYERMDSPFHFRYKKKSPFLVRAERPLSPYRTRAERPLSPISKSQSVPSTPPPEKSRHFQEFASSSYEPLHTKTSSIDSWFTETAQPVAKPRRTRRRPPIPGARPKRPARPPNIPTKPKRPEKPPPPLEQKQADEAEPIVVEATTPAVEQQDTPVVSQTTKIEDEPWASFSELDVELQPMISRGMLLARGSSPSVRKLKQSSREGLNVGSGMSTQAAVQGSPAAPKRPPRPQPPPPPPPPFKPRNSTNTEDTHL